MTNLFPVFLNLQDKKCLVVGAGQVARRKILNLQQCGAAITVISPEAVAEIRQLAEEGMINWERREFEPADLAGAALVFAATDNFQVNRMIARLCREKQVFANIADNPQHCDFYVPSVLKRKSLQIAVSTEGKSPLLARELRRQIAGFITEEYGELVEMLGEERNRIKQSGLEFPERRQLYEALVQADIMDLLKTGQKELARERLKECMSSLRE